MAGANGLATAALAAVLIVAVILTLRGAGNRGTSPASVPPTRPGEASACPESLLPARPATPPNTPIPATPTGRKAFAYVACAFERDPGLRRAEEAGLVHKPDAAQTINGFTLTVERIYVDASCLVIGYTIKAGDWITDDHRLSPGRPTLTDSAGRVYPLYGNTQGGYSGFGSPARMNAGVTSFDMSSLPPDAREETFTFSFAEIPVTSVHPIGEQPGQTITTIYNAERTPISQRAVARAGRPEPVGTAGPWELRFTLPIVPARVAAVGQTVTAAVTAAYQQYDSDVALPRCYACPEVPAEGIAITVERVVVTPSETRVYLRAPAPDLGEQGVDWEIRGIGIEGTALSPQPHPKERQRQPDGSYIVSLTDPLYERPAGEWTLRIGELFAVIPPNPDGRGGYDDIIMRLTGEWTFRFTMP